MDRGSKALVTRSAFFSLIGVILSNVGRADFKTEGKRTSLLYQNGRKNWNWKISEMSSALVYVSTSHSKCGVKLICFVVFVVIGVLIVLAKLSSEFQSLVACKNRARVKEMKDICLSRHRNSAIIHAASHILIKKQNTTPSLDSYCS